MKKQIGATTSPISVKILVFREPNWPRTFWPICSWLIKLQDSLKCNISRKKKGMRLLFCIETKLKFP